MHSPSINFAEIASIRWSDCLDEPFVEEESKKKVISSTSIQRLLAWQADLREIYSQQQQESKNSKRRNLSIEVPPTNFDTMSWSSAATGKPQLTYAERLRRAKEGPKTNLEIGDVEEDSKQNREEKKDDERTIISTIPIKSSIGTAFNLAHSTPSVSSHDETGTTSSPAISSSNSPIPPPPSSISSVQSPSATTILATNQVNIWEARKLQLQEMVKKSENPTSFEGSSDHESIRATQDEVPKKPVNGQLPSKPKENGMDGIDLMNNDAITLKNDGRPESTISNAELGKSTASGSRLEEKPKVTKSNRKKKQNMANQKQQNSDLPSLPPLSDSVNWPSPNDAKVTPALGSQSSSNLQSSSSNDQKTPSQSNMTNGSLLDQLDVEILRQPGSSDKVRKGKQWIPIVPTITNSSPNVRFSQQQKNTNKSQSGNRRTTDNAYTKTLSDRRTASDPQSTAPQSRLLRTDDVGEEGLANVTTKSNEIRSDEANPKSVEMNGKVTQSQQKLSINDTSTQTTSSSEGQRRKSGTRTPRGARGRGGSKRSSDNEAIGQKDDTGNHNVDNDAKSVESGAESSRSGQRRDTLPNSRQPPSGPRSPNPNQQGPGGGGTRRSTMHSMSASERRYYDPNLMFYGQAPTPPHPMFNASPFLHPGFGPSGPFYPAPPFINGLPFIESTPVEFAPNGTSTTTEPTSALLWQIEFYFSHQNLQGDFYLRKMMDSQGFVPTETLASFNRVKRLAGENAELIKETIKYSKTLQVNEDGTKIRKAFGWEPYVLVEGQHAQQWHSPSMQQPFPINEPMTFPYNGGIEMPLSPLHMPPVRPHEMMRLPPPQMNRHHSPQPNRNMNFTNNHNPPFQQQQQRMRNQPRTTTISSTQPYQSQDETVRIGNPNESNGIETLVNSTQEMNLKENINSQQQIYDSDQGEEDEEEPQLGVVASAGLGGALNTTNPS